MEIEWISPFGEGSDRAICNLMIGLRLSCSVLLLVLLGAGGCTRTNDGSLVPTYRLGVTESAMLPMPVIERSPELEPNEAAVFPPPPEPAIVDAPVSYRGSAPRRTKARATSSRSPQESHLYDCRTDAPPEGRVRMECR